MYSFLLRIRYVRVSKQAVLDENQEKQLRIVLPLFLAHYKVVTIVELQASNQIVAVEFQALDLIFQTFFWL